MGKDRNGHLRESSDEETEAPANPKSDSEQEDTKSKSHSKSDKGEKPSKSRRRQSSSSSSEDEDSYSDSESESGSESDYSGSESEYLDSEEEERRRRKRKRREREERERKRRRKEKEKKRRRKEKEREEERKRKKRKEKERKEKKKKKKKERLERGKKGAVTNSWGKYGVIKETDMWNKRPEFTAWLAEVKQINLENLPNWEEKQLFKEFMEDHNTATFPSKKYYGLDAYYRHKMEKDMKKGVKKSLGTERTEFNDEEQRRQELLIAREKQKEGQVEALKHAMQSGMAQAMKEQAQLREEMAYHYKVGNFEAAAAIQKRLDPDIPM